MTDVRRDVQSHSDRWCVESKEQMSLIGGPVEDLPPILKTSYWESTPGSEEN